mmetsp:Transcript_70561/g.138717  ORF Transcript_70561/g.138717 Transcript_70561/m.138717 type:complete len:280 (-) Transcript_70561:261-1100(-)
MSTFLRQVGTFTSWFKIPSQGMERYECLSHATAVCVALSDRKPLRFLTSAHVAQPWMWPHYYPQDWIRYIRDEHTRYTLDVRADDGSVLASYELDKSTIDVHPTRDIVSLSLGVETELTFISQPEKLSILPVSLSRGPIGSDTPVTVAGHALVDRETEMDTHDEFCSNADGNALDGRILPLQLPESSSGCFLAGRTGAQSFLRVFGEGGKPHVLKEGMCGGGVFGEGGEFSHPSTLYGVIDGVVPMGSLQAPHLAGCASFVDANELRAWLSSSGGDRCE